MNIKIDINNCRVCLTSGQGQPLFGDGNQYAKQYAYATQLKAAKGDGLPELICSKCIGRLKIAYGFRKQSESSEQHLRKFLAALNKQPTDSDDNDDDELEAQLLAEVADEPEEEVPAVPAKPVKNPVPEEKTAPKSDTIKSQRLAAKETMQIASIADRVKPDASKVSTAKKETAPVAAPTTPQRMSTRNAQQPAQQPKMPTKPPRKPELMLQAKREPDTSIADADNDNDTESAVDEEQPPLTADSPAPNELVQEFVISTMSSVGFVADDDMNEEHLLSEAEELDDGVEYADGEEMSLADIEEHDREAYDDYDEDYRMDGGHDDDEISVINSATTAKRRPAARRNAGDAPPKKQRKRNLAGEEAAATGVALKIGGIHICAQCNKDFSTRTNLLRHIQTHDGSKPFRCTVCDSGFTQNGSLKQHMLIHSGQRPFVCEFCDRGFTQSKSLTFHMRRHTGEKPFVCQECGISFRQKDGLKRHRLVRHPVGPKAEFPCDECGKSLQSRYSLKMHKKRHDEERNYFAVPKDEKKAGRPVAAAAATSAAGTVELVEDGASEASPSAVGVFECEQCDRKFASQASLVAHRRQHNAASGTAGAGKSASDAAPSKAKVEMSCPQCDGMVFATRALYTAHMKQVHGESVAAVAVAGKLRGGKAAVVVTAVDDEQVRVDKPYACRECGVRFAKEIHRSVHVKLVHGKRCKKYQCPHCEKAYAIKEHLQTHMARHDPNTATSFDSVIEQLDHDYDEAELYDDEEQYTIEEGDLLDAEDRLQMETDAEAEADIDNEHCETVTGDILDAVDGDDDADDKPMFECADCSAVFATAAAMVEHRREEHAENDVACVCEACDQMFDNVLELEAHIVDVHGDQVMQFGDENEEVEVATTTTTVVTATEKEVAGVASKAVELEKAVKSTEGENKKTAVNGQKVEQTKTEGE